jgi:superfamily II DNA or RNA helicase
MTARAEIDLVSYDRLFPSQDFVPKGSFGNLIALPLQGECRKRGTTLFLDPSTLEPFPDQWAFLSQLPRLSPTAATSLSEGVGQVDAGPDAACYRPPSPAGPAPPSKIRATAGAMLGIDRIGVPPALLAALKHLASVHNPDFYEKEKMRFSTWNTPRLIRCYRETLDQLLLPRGLRERAEALVSEAGSHLAIRDGWGQPEPVAYELHAELTADQQAAVDAMAKHDMGMLIAPPGSGKTVIGCGLIAHHGVPTLVIVDRQPLIEQWRDRLVTHLGLDRKQIGQIGGGRRRTAGVVDVAMAQSLARRDDVPDVCGNYGLVVVDECHHVPAVTFERGVRQIPSRRWLGLTATPYRRDGLQALMAMQCGPIRHRMAGSTAGHPLRQLDLLVHETAHPALGEGSHIQEEFRWLVEDEGRNARVCVDIAGAVAAGRNSLVLTRWTDHLERLVGGLRAQGLEPLSLHGGMGKKARAAVISKLAEPPPEGGLLLVATASLLGEGFDCPALDTLFLAFPIRFKGSVVQYVGRILRPTDTKDRVEVHDYLDIDVPVLARMYDERSRAYASLGFDVPRRPRTARPR